MTQQEAGAFGFGLVIGWFLYFVNRYRRSEANFTDLTTVLGAVGGAAVTRLFTGGADLFGAYGIGLATGFFCYFILLVIMVGMSKNFGVDYLPDGRRTPPGADQTIPADVNQPAFTLDVPEAGTDAVKIGVAAAVAAVEGMKQGR